MTGKDINIRLVRSWRTARFARFKYMTPTGSNVRSNVQPVGEATRFSEEEPADTVARLSRTKQVIAAIVVLLVAGALYGAVYFREDSIAGGIGANLVPAERVLKGEVPYRDFYKIQTPGILMLNAALFKLWGATLLTALRGVLVFKVLTVVMVFLVARLVISWKTALIPTVLALVWLPPGGPFRPAPIQYEMLFTLAALYFVVRWVGSRNALNIFAAGLTIGVVALFKQNVGVYTAVALVVAIVMASRSGDRQGGDETPSLIDSVRSNRAALIAAVIGLTLPVAALFAYLIANHALGSAIRVFVQGPGEHIQMKLTGYPLPKHALIILIAAVLAVNLVIVIGQRLPRFRAIVFSVSVFGAEVCSALVPQSFIDNSIYWFPPVLFLYGSWAWLRGRNKQSNERAPDQRKRAILLVLLLFSIASYLEVFPRSVRGLLIGTLPPAFILLVFLFANYSLGWPGEDATPQVSRWFTLSSPRRFQLSVIAVVASVFAVRTIAPHYFYLEAGRLSFKADTELSFDRGRGVYLPLERAEEVNAAVDFIRARVDQGGYFFAHSLDATPYYFLADRYSPTGATLWNDAGTDDAERTRTMQMLRDRDVRLVLTNDQAMSAERYQPLIEILQSSFHEAATIGKIKFLERNY